MFKILVFLSCFSSIFCAWDFPVDFNFGVSTSAYQIEGGWNADGKGVSALDVTPLALDGSDGKVACDSYHKWETDIQMVKNLSVQYYRFSLSWTRLYPDGFTNKINQAGVDYYNNLINGLLEIGVEPVVTLYHWDIPQVFQAIGGLNNQNIITYFAEYARGAFELFGDRVKLWITFNEPQSVCQALYTATNSEAKPLPMGSIEYICSRNILLAHAEAYHIYDKEFRSKQKGRISITLNVEWAEPDSDSKEDKAAAEQRLQFEFGIYANPIFNFDYPQIVKERVDKISKSQNFSTSRLPKLSLFQKLRITGTWDFLGLNHYSTWMVKHKNDVFNATPSFQNDMGTERYQPGNWVGLGTNKVVPWGLRKLLAWLKRTYKNPEILITECGFPDQTGELEDDDRIQFFKGYLNATLEAIHLDKVNVKSFMAWSLMDNFEWLQGYRSKFGLYYVDFNDSNRPRTPKKSAEFFKHVAETRRID